MTTRNSIIASRSVRCRATVLVVASALLLTGCGGDAPGDTGSASPSATTATTASATPTPTQTPVYRPADGSGPAQNVPVPALPEVAKTETKEGLEAFARYWFELLSYGYETGDAEPLSAVSSAKCTFCQGLIGNIKTAWADGKWIAGGQIETPAVTAKVPAGEPTDVVLQVLQKELKIYNPDGSLYQEPTAPTNSGSQATATFGETGWIVSDLGLIR